MQERAQELSARGCAKGNPWEITRESKRELATRESLRGEKKRWGRANILQDFGKIMPLIGQVRLF